MAQQWTVDLVDDLTGDAADNTLEFGLHGKIYEIDLTQVHTDTLVEGLAPFIAGAREIGKWQQQLRPQSGVVRLPPNTAPPKATTGRKRRVANMPPQWQIAQQWSPAQRKQVRAWAQSKKMKCADMARIPVDVIDKYIETNGQPTGEGFDQAAS